MNNLKYLEYCFDLNRQTKCFHVYDFLLITQDPVPILYELSIFETLSKLKQFNFHNIRMCLIQIQTFILIKDDCILSNTPAS